MPTNIEQQSPSSLPTNSKQLSSPCHFYQQTAVPITSTNKQPTAGTAHLYQQKSALETAREKTMSTEQRNLCGQQRGEKITITKSVRTTTRENITTMKSVRKTVPEKDHNKTTKSTRKKTATKTKRSPQLQGEKQPATTMFCCSLVGRRLFSKTEHRFN